MTIYRPLMALLVALLLAACSASNKAQIEVDEDGQPVTDVYSNNSLLGSRISIPDLKQKRVGDLLYVQATLENDWKFELDFQYKFKWFDADGFELAPESQPWQQVVMAGRSQNNVKGIAPNPSAVRFEIWVRE
ncbi:MAG: YcfL family protein [Pseudomonadales bacterium]|nr:YcfL family protein [Pseudomonadales bacterium]